MFCVQHPLVLPCLGFMLVQCSATHDARALGRCPSLAGLAFYIYPWLFTGCIVCCIYHAIHATTAGEIAAHMSASFLRAAPVPYVLFGTWSQALCLARCHVSLYCLTCLLSLPGVQSLSTADLSSHAHRCREAGLRMSSGAMHPELRR